MESVSENKKNKGGRPKLAVRRTEQLAVMCNKMERLVIAHHAKSVNQTLSEFLRNLGLHRKIDIEKKVLPKEVLLLTATLNHAAANLNQIAKKRNQNDELNLIERAELLHLSNTLKQLASDIKTYLK
jgi:hypothetical protein